MESSKIGLFGFLALLLLLLLLLLFIRMPVGIAMMLVGTVGIYLIRAKAALPTLAGEIIGEGMSYPLTIIPLFVLMGI
ncbi:MAG: hypothetical protein ACI8VW_002313 [bacterium]|jgi:hypothetical protein